MYIKTMQPYCLHVAGIKKEKSTLFSYVWHMWSSGWIPILVTLYVFHSIIYLLAQFIAS